MIEAERLSVLKITDETVIRSIDEIVAQTENGSDYIDAIITYCERNSLEIEVVASIIKGNNKVKARVQEQAEELNFLPRRAKLPIVD